MAKIVAVHGIGQQFKGDAVIHKEWWPALQSGLHLAGGELTDPAELTCPFYGHLFRRKGTLGAGETFQPGDLAGDEIALLEQLWKSAASVEPERVPSPQEVAAGESLARTPQFVQRALNALSKSKFFADLSQNFMIGDLKQVVAYLGNPEIHEAAIKTVLDRLTDDTRVVVGHSLGSVVAYEALCRQPAKVVSFVTVGSPLGIRNVIFDRLTPPPNEAGLGKWPGKVLYWTNIADAGDIVAMQRELKPRFGSQVKDLVIYNGSDAHHGERYLTTREAGEAIRAAL